MSLTVGELRGALSKCDDDDVLVVLAKDAEGNSFYPLDELWETAETTYSGEITNDPYEQKVVILCMSTSWIK